MIPPVLPSLGLAPDADEARGLLEDELAKTVYVEAQPSIFERILTDLLRGIARLFDGIGSLGAGPGTLVLAIGAALVIVVAVVLIKPRLNARGRTPEAAVFDDATHLTAAQYRDRASAHAAGGDWNRAVADVLRAVIRASEERVVIAEQPGRTATEAAVQLGRVHPALSPDIAWLADLFNETHYGKGTATGEQYRRASLLDASFSSARPAGSPDHGADVLAAPR